MIRNGFSPGLTGDPSHRPRERRPQWRAMAINYNIMVSLDISVQLANPTWPNPRVLTHRASFFRERDRAGESARKREGETAEAAATYSYVLLPAAQPTLIFAPEDEANPTMRAAAHATVPPHPLSSNVSFFPRTGIAQ